MLHFTIVVVAALFASAPFTTAQPDFDPQANLGGNNNAALGPSSTRTSSSPQWKIVWMADKEWEATFIEKVLLRDVPPEAIEVAQCIPIENCLADGIVVIVGRSAYSKRLGQVDFLLRGAQERNVTSIVIHISDEDCSMGTEWYPFADLVLRQYWCEPQSLGKNVVTMPCGLKTGWDYTHDVLSASQRACNWSFYGHAGGSRSYYRENMMSTMQEVRGGCTTPLKTEEENDQVLDGATYTQKMCNTIIAPCPRGFGLETFRFNEALECGAIPIVDDDGKVFHKYMPGLLDHVITTDGEWRATSDGQPLVEYVRKLLSSPTELERRRLATMNWYLGYKRTLMGRIKEVIQRARKVYNGTR